MGGRVIYTRATRTSLDLLEWRLGDELEDDTAREHRAEPRRQGRRRLLGLLDPT